MKKLILLLLLHITTYSQSSYSNWELEGNIGLYKTTVGTANNYHNFVGTPFMFDIGITHFVTPSFGLQASVGYQNLESNKYNNSFSTDYGRISMLGVWDASEAFNLYKWYHIRLGLGLGYTEFYPNLDIALTDRERAGHIIGNLNNVFDLSERLSLNAAVELIGHYNMDYTFDGTVSTGDPLDADISRNTGISDGTIYNFKVGLTYDLSRKEEREECCNDYSNEIDSLRMRILNLENQEIVTNVYNNTFVQNSDPYKEKIYFKYDESTLNFNDNLLDNQQVNILDRIYLKMIDNPDHKLEIIGYADYRGNEGYNEILGFKRANAVKNILVELGISSERFIVKSSGELNASNVSGNGTQFDRVVYFNLLNN